MTDTSLSLLKGTVDLLILKALSGDAKHGYGVSEWIESVTEAALLMEEGTLYPALHRLDGKGLIESEWGLSANNRRAKYYRLTSRGRQRLEREAQAWESYSRAIAKALAAPVAS